MNGNSPPAVGDFELLCFFAPGQTFAVDFNKVYNRATTDAELEAQINETWEAKRRSSPHLFNGTKFRLHSVEKPGRNPDWLLRFGVTDYKSFQGTNCAPNWPDLLREKPEHLSYPLGNAAIVVLADGKVVMLKRSAHVGECPNTVVFPGGHPEPEEIGMKVLAEAMEMEESWASQTAGVMHELEDSIMREVVEETGIARDSLKLEACIGVTRRMLNIRPCIFYLATSDASSEEVMQRYTDGKAVDAEESKGMFFLLSSELVDRVIEKDEINMPGCHRGGVLLYKKYLQAKKEPAKA